MTENEGTLRMQPSGRFAVCRPGRDPIEITSGDVFRVEVPGAYPEMQRTRMEFLHHEEGGGGEYYSVNGYRLRDGLRAAIGESDLMPVGSSPTPSQPGPPSDPTLVARLRESIRNLRVLALKKPPKLTK
jgi:hypothetical protein